MPLPPHSSPPPLLFFLFSTLMRQRRASCPINPIRVNSGHPFFFPLSALSNGLWGLHGQGDATLLQGLKYEPLSLSLLEFLILPPLSYPCDAPSSGISDGEMV
ncbi:MAG: hypothetical protein DHS80DRAFT_24182 [Piptocephalis tieghemiana]|nr:MAG: hypothetical protein DHS80DRAFT_24182 [Piptocephalis tieghemiana]